MYADVKVGDVIKSKDFPGNDACYMVGKVVAIVDNNNLYNCKAIMRVWEGVATAVSNTADFTTQRLGLVWHDELYPDRITVIA